MKLMIWQLIPRYAVNALATTGNVQADAGRCVLARYPKAHYEMKNLLDSFHAFDLSQNLTVNSLISSLR